jgi:hypothetical protein
MFIDLLYDSIGRPVDVQFLYNRRVVEVLTDRNYTLRFARRGLTQLLHAIGRTRREFNELRPEDIMKEWDKMPVNTIFSTFKDHGEDGGEVYVVYRVTTDYYVPIPHRVLFTHIDNVLKDIGFDIGGYEVMRWFARTAARWRLWSISLNYARKGDALNIYLYVSNANTGNDSIKIIGYGEILLCKNGLTLTKGTRVRVLHVKDMAGTLERVARGVATVIDRLRAEKEFLVLSIEKLQNIELTPEREREWINRLYEILPQKYHSVLSKYWSRNVNVFGNTAEALFQTITALNSRVRNKAIHNKLDKYAHHILELAHTISSR